MTSARWRPLALQDVKAAAAWYGSAAGTQRELAFIKALESAVAMIALHPDVGSSRYAMLLQLPEIRSWPLKGYPYLLFYTAHADDIVIWRVLQMQRDIPAWMMDSP
ncbi:MULTISPECIES: type II toxin-antitoxin system RelE/ParE family toxin [Xanthomonas]|uniref:Plasmid stabilization protein n=1 Tax=Xanthomonas cucurbitae TaxID=56453 RepID=A0A2S7DG55_9XANT|nr:type II toxin-antitoxin system RelE/ParE family toxin [Xanthomonas cucurbitae]PPU72803.1 plasmid stabilization protein [Xanthomonas cucurbitae]QHG86366.1 type II toxin-antitoxin system RelE/ParE family toxin [Xanthomonas cucurbitae]WDM68618.1 type II toxin-antitoxin system RelE/ParE family toxin [Xanthomonas cucurbitae]WDM72492.1 type II toxin-antitoxin system RelE/ParE family toxin [Xanthomonas cucurbitae]WDM76282.1 type II toxin-antitoxin system RelE/ParE family toxin [Xanthomonas cucurbi